MAARSVDAMLTDIRLGGALAFLPGPPGRTGLPIVRAGIAPRRDRTARLAALTDHDQLECHS